MSRNHTCKIMAFSRFIFVLALWLQERSGDQ